MPLLIGMFDNGEMVFIMAYLVPDGIVHFFNCDVVSVRFGKDMPVECSISLQLHGFFVVNLMSGSRPHVNTKVWR